MPYPPTGQESRRGSKSTPSGASLLSSPSRTRSWRCTGWRVSAKDRTDAVRIDGLLWDDADQELLSGQGRVVFVLAEFQVLDRETASRNEQGDTYDRIQFQFDVSHNSGEPVARSTVTWHYTRDML